MNDLMRPALYDAWHHIEAVRPSGTRHSANVVGPVCETGDTFATGRVMDEVAAGDLVVFRTAGAYAAAMSSTYNSRPLTPEVLVDGGRWAIVRPRVDVETLIGHVHDTVLKETGQDLQREVKIIGEERRSRPRIRKAQPGAVSE